MAWFSIYGERNALKKDFKKNTPRVQYYTWGAIFGNLEERPPKMAK